MLGVSNALIIMIRKIEKYDLLEEIGHGGMATVFRAHDRRLERDVAIKVMHPHLRAAPEARRRFTREAKSVARLRHPNILEIYDYSGEDSEESYIAAELLTGPTLREFGDGNSKIPPEVAAALTIEIAQALGAAHDQGIIHRDVKPENVMLHRGRFIKLADFGIAQMRDGNTMTATGQILGSPGHMAPEQIEGRECDNRSDIFSLGTVLYRLAVGCLPFTGSNPHAVLKRIVDSDFPDPLRVRPSIGDELAAIIRRAMSRDRADRYQTAAEFEDALKAFVGIVKYEDPRALWQTYVADPKKVGDELQESIVESYTERGVAAVKSGDSLSAINSFNRVLAYDESNETVLRALDQMGRSHRVRRFVSAGIAAGMMIVGSLLLWPSLSALLSNAETETAATIEDATDLPSDERSGSTTDSLDTATDASAAEVLAQAQTDEERVTPSGDGGSVEPDSEQTEAEDPATPTLDTPEARGVASNAPRLVRFVPSLQNVSISVDGAPARPFGPSFQDIQLTPGRHRFQIMGEQVQTLTVTRNIQAGTGALAIPFRLRLKPARLYVGANANGDVAVTGGARGRTRSFINIPMTESATDVTITVTAPGHRMYRGRQRVVAGRQTNHVAQLESIAAAQ
jgi:serine/threonine-protein kinase